MTRARAGIALFNLIVLAVVPLACHRTTAVRKNTDVGPVVKDTVVAPITDRSVVEFFKDTTVGNGLSTEGQTFRLQTPAQRQALRATIRKERELWQARKPRDYRYLLRVGCFCPGTRGWLLIEVRRDQKLRAWDKTGRSAALTDWNTVSIDALYDNLERSADSDGEVRIAFDPRWHFPKYVRTNALRVPDAWSITEARALHVLTPN